MLVAKQKNCQGLSRMHLSQYLGLCVSTLFSILRGGYPVLVSDQTIGLQGLVQSSVLPLAGGQVGLLLGL